jgi:arylsulfatase A
MLPLAPVPRLVLLHLAFAVAAIPAAGAPGAAPDRPNIVFILADDLGSGHLGFNGQRLIRTPNIDRLRAEGRSFTQAYAGCAVCAPSRSTLMTGMHMGHTSVRANTGGLPLLEDDVTVAEVLQRAGYATGGFGKWGLGDAHTSGMATRKGFDTFFGYYHQVHAHSFYPAYLWRDGEPYHLPGNSGRESDGLTGDQRGQYAHDEIHSKAIDFIQSNRHRPFFCYVPYTLPHLELLVPEDSLAEYAGRFPEPYPYTSPDRHFQDQPQPRAALAAMITRLDRSVGQILTLLQRLGLDEKTIVFFASDNGAPAGDLPGPDFFRGNRHLRGAKGSLYEGGLRVPLVARWPGRIPANSSSELPCYFPDVMPTLAELAGATADLPPGLDGISLVPALLGEEAAGRPQPRHEMMYWEWGAGPRLQRAVRTERWKGVIPAPGKPLELFDLATDESETTNVAAREPAVVARIEAWLRTCRTEPRPRETPSGSGNRPFR